MIIWRKVKANAGTNRVVIPIGSNLVLRQMSGQNTTSTCGFSAAILRNEEADDGTQAVNVIPQAALTPDHEVGRWLPGNGVKVQGHKLRWTFYRCTLNDVLYAVALLEDA